MFNNINSYGDNVALILQNGDHVTYTELFALTSDFASHLCEHSLLLIITQTSHEPIIAYIAAIMNDVTVMFVDIKTSNDDIDALAQKYCPDFIFAPHEWFDEKLHLYNATNSTMDNYLLVRQAEKRGLKINPTLAILLPTSGSLGSAKFVRLSHENLKSNTDAIISYLNIKHTDRSITTMPIGYSFMLSIINSHMIAGASIVICNNSVVEKEFWSKARDNKITSISGVPVLFQILVRMGLEKMAIPTLRQLTQAGGKLSNSLASKVIAFASENGAEFITMYGQTEASPRMSYLDWQYAEKKIGSIGKPILQTQMWLESEDGEIVNTPDRQGEIIFSGTNVCLGYADGAADLSRGDDNLGILRTGDLATCDADGFYFVTGRLKRIAKIDGFRINLDDLDERVRAAGVEVACVEDKEKIVAFYVGDMETDEMVDFLQSLTGQKKTIFSCRKIAEIPRTSSGKISYKDLQEVT